jgi:preprotein translocase subunit SecG
MFQTAYTFEYFLYGTLMLLIAVFLILLVLVQRGRGGGLTGALGGMGGQSAFGTKAGDTFTRITYVTAMVWIFLCMVAVKRLHDPRATNARLPGGAETAEAEKTEGGAVTKTATEGDGKSADAPASKSGKTEKTDEADK